MAELYHIGIRAADVPHRVLLVEDGIDALSLFEPETLVPLAARREYTTFRGTDEFGAFLVCQTGIGCPQLAIAVEEFARAGARSQVYVMSCRCRACMDEAVDAHATVLPFGAARDEGTTAHYAPVAFPALPDPTLLEALRGALPDAESALTRTVDVPDTWLWLDGYTSGSEPVDLGVAALFVVAAARHVAAAAVIIGQAQQPSPARLGARVTFAAGPTLEAWS